ncbi:DNA (cytosine-5)-methyltransferase 3C-like [Dreissena polymorpha]|uniref:DNA (cytosine-5-)-methyltransferase n=1 Tax=Dreissena polymorpha TaxID=45954 RepID=A0A9D4QHV6_DREPO|nr:DNA (cytosine-5)-methyltransferase 3C-like [Dreissena polymorpha]KAH3832261.1 hypothetical protein DPMN_105542 [Dreissena polymorpha]
MENKTVIKGNKITTTPGPSSSKKSKFEDTNTGFVTENGGQVSAFTEQSRAVPIDDPAEPFVASVESQGSFEKVSTQEMPSAHETSANIMSHADKYSSAKEYSEETSLSEDIVRQLMIFQDRSLRQRKSVNYKYSKTEHFVHKNIDNSSKGANSCEKGTHSKYRDENSLDNNFKTRNCMADVNNTTEKCSSVHQSTIKSKEKFTNGSVVWGKFGKGKWWPGMTLNEHEVGRCVKPCFQWVYWLSDDQISQVKLDHIEDFHENLLHRLKQKGTLLGRGIQVAVKICCERAGIPLPVNNDFLQHWAAADSTFHLIKDNAQRFMPDKDSPLPSFVIENLAHIRTQLLPAIDEETPKKKHVPWKNEKIQVQKESYCNDLGATNSSREMKIPTQRKITNVIVQESAGAANASAVNRCNICCEDSDVRFNHPLFQWHICIKCKDSLKSSFHAVDDDGCSMFCCVCGDGGKMFVCDDLHCGKAFCFACVRKYAGNLAFDKTHETSPWHCFLCQDYSMETHGQLVPRADRDQEILHFFQPGHVPLCQDLQYLTLGNKRKLRVLSLFDGIGTGRLALDALGIDVELYAISEVDKDAMAVSSFHYNVTHLGDVWNINKDTLSDLCPIDLVLGGPPCNDLSIVNPGRKGFNGSGILVVKYMALVQDVEALCRGSNHVFWLMENTAHMPKHFYSLICQIMGMEPTLWDAKYFTGQNRARYFWGNIPGMYSGPEFCRQLEKERTELEAALLPNFNRIANVSHTRTITSGSNSLTITNGLKDHVVNMNGEPDQIWVQELERLFGFPTHYTDVGELTLSRRRRVLGKAWSVPVIKHLLSPLRSYFKLKDSRESMV